MFVYNNPVWDFENALWQALNCQSLKSGPETVDINTRVHLETDDNVISFSEVSSPTVPPFYYGVSANTTFIFVGPTQDINMASAIIKGYLPIVNLPPRRPQNDWADGAAQYLVERARVNHMPATSSYVIAGYSAGGMVATSLFAALHIANPDLNLSLMTFGSPRTLTGAFAGTLQHSGIARWMNDTDAVPLLPPRLTLAPAWAAALPTANITQYGNFVHTAGGISINASGVARYSVLPQGSQLAPTLSLAGFLFAQVDGNNADHSIDTTIARLRVALGSRGQSQQQAIPFGIMEPVADVATREANAIQRQQVQNIFRAGQVQDAVPVVIPETLKAKVVRQGRQYMVYWGDTFIATGPTKKKAFRLKNDFNHMLFDLQRQAVTEPDALVRQFQQYFDLATQEGNGFQPVMQDQFPE